MVFIAIPRFELQTLQTAGVKHWFWVSCSDGAFLFNKSHRDEWQPSRRSLLHHLCCDFSFKIKLNVFNVLGLLIPSWSESALLFPLCQQSSDHPRGFLFPVWPYNSGFCRADHRSHVLALLWTIQMPNHAPQSPSIPHRGITLSLIKRMTRIHDA